MVAPYQGYKIGVIGLDAIHAVAFTRIINEGEHQQDDDFRVVAAYPFGSKTLQHRIARVPEYTKAMEALGVRIVQSINELIEQVDFILLTSNDGHVHLEQAIPVLEAKKRMFIDKPLAGNWNDSLAIYHKSKETGTPVFSSSALRFISGIQNIDKGRIGTVVGAHTFSPAQIEPSLPDMLWYGIHGIEMLFSVMGCGCETVMRTTNRDYDYLVGVWNDGRIGSFRGFRAGKSGFGGMIYGEKDNVALGGFEGYKPLVYAILRFFRTGEPPVAMEETLEIIAFILAAEESKVQSGATIALRDVVDFGMV